ncbi:MAG: PAS domain S-box protein [Acidimicrobiia bacterium]|nr:PAS domain S-box protein [Acidimicrobiia bacterium]
MPARTPAPETATTTTTTPNAAPGASAAVVGGEAGAGTARPFPWLAVAVAIAWVVLAAVVLMTLERGTVAQKVAWVLAALVPAAAFAVTSLVAAGRCSGPRRRFWHVMAVGMAVQSLGLLWRASVLLAGKSVELADGVYSILTLVAILLFAGALVVRVRMVSATTWMVQFLDAAGIAVVVTTLTALPLARHLEHATQEARTNAVQPLIIALLAAGALSLLLAPLPLAKKRVEIALTATTVLALMASWVSLYFIVLTGALFLPSVGILLAAAFAVGSTAPFFENPLAQVPTTAREDYDSVAWPYLALSVLPLAALAAVLRGGTAVEVVAIGGLLAGVLVAVLRQVQVLRTQRSLIGLAQSHTEERRQDAAIARSLLEVSRRLAISPDRVTAERAVLNALAEATTAPVVRIVEPDGTVTGDSGSPASLGPEAAVALVRDARGDMAPGAPRHYHDPAADVEGVLVGALTTGGELCAVLSAEGHGWKPVPNETDLVSGLAHQLGVALERAELVGRLSRSERLYRRIIDAVPVGVVEIDARGVVLRANRAFTRITGLAEHKIIGNVVFGLFAVVELEPDDALARFEAVGELRCRARVVTFGGDELMLSLDVAQLGLVREAGRDAVCFVRDDTELVKLRRRVGRAAADVEVRRTATEMRRAATISALASDALTRLDDAAAAVAELARTPQGDRLEVARVSVATTVHTVEALVEALESYT